MGNISCPICGMSGFVKKHGRTKSTGGQRYLCAKCNKTFQSKYTSNRIEDIKKMEGTVAIAFNDPEMPTLKEKSDKFKTTPHESADDEKAKRLARQFQNYANDCKQKYRLDIVCPYCKTSESIICKKMNVPCDKEGTFRYDCILYCASCDKEFKVSKHKKRCANPECGSYDVSKQTRVKIKKTNQIKQVWRCRDCGRYFRSLSRNDLESKLKSFLAQMPDTEKENLLEQIDDYEPEATEHLTMKIWAERLLKEIFCEPIIEINLPSEHEEEG